MLRSVVIEREKKKKREIIISSSEKLIKSDDFDKICSLGGRKKERRIK